MSWPPSPGKTKRDGVLTSVKTVLEITVVALFLVTFLAQPLRIPSVSMEPTLQVGDLLLVDKQSFAYEGKLARILPPAVVHRGDLVVFHFPGDLNLHLVKRVVGLPGDRLRLHEGRVLLNGEPLAEPYAFYADSRPNGFRDEFPSLREADPNVDPGWWIAMRRAVASGGLVVPPDSYFVLGDNRNDSEDSRYWGFVPRSAIIGRPLIVYFATQAPAPPTASRLRRFGSGLRSLHVLR